MKLSKQEVTVREAFVTELFRTTPGLTGTAANDALAAKFPHPDGSPGRKMRAARLYALRKAANTPPAAVAPATVPEAAPVTVVA